ncbi:OmpA family protein [Flavobacterium sp. J49]|uniref:OmpA family protein n=1 Tax=Flavobacterium sp. J49 TaxID=2718534 RepID=UPI0015930532|nr:OmpA family protein [Flavobacterium sp. J49]MBF6640133.1 OmpA family protein [Flavobacterium sp. J49]NIC01378.1 OmpA family protein [Flavobacterium sp. J49]
MKVFQFGLLLLCSFLGFSQNKIEVFFDFNKDMPNPISMVKLNQWIAAHKSVEITEILGYCDSVDDSRYNKDLAMRRINSVLKIVKRDSVKVSDKLVLKPFGKDFQYSKIQEENRKVTIYYHQIKEEKTIEVNKEKEDKVERASDLVAKEKSELAQKFKKAKKGDLIRINNINFQFNSERMMAESEPLLLELLQILYDNPKLKIAIHGHICCNPNGMDTKLSYRRALVIFKYLTKFDIEMNRLSYKGFGSNDPIYKLPERNEAERKANRRVEILIVDK